MADPTYRRSASEVQPLTLTPEQASAVFSLVEETLQPVLCLHIVLKGDEGGLLSEVAELLRMTLHKFQTDLLDALKDATKREVPHA